MHDCLKKNVVRIYLIPSPFNIDRHTCNFKGQNRIQSEIMDIMVFMATLFTNNPISFARVLLWILTSVVSISTMLVGPSVRLVLTNFVQHHRDDTVDANERCAIKYESDTLCGVDIQIQIVTK